MKCPECEKEMRWVGDQYIEEDEVLQSVYDCEECHIDVLKNRKG